MPTYEYACQSGHVAEQYRKVDARDERLDCADCGAGMVRQITIPQRPIRRPLGYSLKPGDRGYWRFETPNGIPDRPQLAPFAVEEQTMRHPPIPTDE